MNKNYFNELNDMLGKAQVRLEGLCTEIYGPKPQADESASHDTTPFIQMLAEEAMSRVNYLHDQISALENAIKGK